MNAKGIERAEIMGDWYEEMSRELMEDERTEAFEDEPKAQPIIPGICWDCGHEIEQGRCSCHGVRW